MVWVSAVDWIPAVDVGKLKNDEPKLLQANELVQFRRVNIVFYARPERSQLRRATSGQFRYVCGLLTYAKRVRTGAPFS